MVNIKRFVPNGPGLSPELLRPVKNPDSLPPWLPRRRTVLVPCARNAILLGCRALGLKKGDGVLLPAFVCNTVSAPLAKAGVRIVLFNVLRDGSFDWDDAKKRLNKNVKVLLYYHYLGVPQGLEKAMAFCRRHGLFLFEDCAHALFTQWKGKDAGRFGDIAVHSIRKTIPVNYGAALIVNNPRLALPAYRPNRALTPAFLRHLADTQSHHFKLYLQSRDFSRRVARQSFMQRLGQMEKFFSDPSRFYPLDDLSRLVMHNADPAAVRRRRRENFLRYLRNLRGIAFLRGLPAGASPLYFPFWVERRRDALKIRLEKAGIEPARMWPKWFLPGGAYRRFGDAAYLADHTLTLPCHQDLGPAEVDYACAMVKKLM